MLLNLFTGKLEKQANHIAVLDHDLALKALGPPFLFLQAKCIKYFKENVSKLLMIGGVSCLDHLRKDLERP